MNLCGLGGLGVRLLWQAINDAVDPIFQMRFAKIDEKSQPVIT